MMFLSKIRLEKLIWKIYFNKWLKVLLNTFFSYEAYIRNKYSGCQKIHLGHFLCRLYRKEFSINLGLLLKEKGDGVVFRVSGRA